MTFTASVESSPMGEINMTPLIDVMLVLLIMFIITIPMQTHAVKIDTPQPTIEPSRVLPTMNEVAITAANQVQWNGAPVDLTVLRQYLDQSQMMPEIPELHVRPAAGAHFVRVDEVLAVIKRAHVSRMGFVGNEAYANY